MNYHEEKEGQITLEPRPLHLQIEVAAECNISCLHCPRTYGLHRKGDEDLSDAVLFFDCSLLSVLQDSAAPVHGVTLHGFGEPLLHPCFFEIIRFFRASDTSVRFTTNGTLLTRETAREIVCQRVEYVFVSIDSSDPVRFSRLRCGADLPSILENLRYLNELKANLGSEKPAVGVMFVVSRFNHDQALGILELAKIVGAREVFFNPFIAPSPKFRNWQWEPQDRIAWRKRITDEASQLEIQVKFHFGSQSYVLPTGKKRCRRLEGSIYVAVDGRIFPCCYHPHNNIFSLGSLRERPLAQIWSGIELEMLRSRLRAGEAATAICRSCPEFTP